MIGAGVVGVIVVGAAVTAHKHKDHSSTRTVGTQVGVIAERIRTKVAQ